MCARVCVRVRACACVRAYVSECACVNNRDCKRTEQIFVFFFLNIKKNRGDGKGTRGKMHMLQLEGTQRGEVGEDAHQHLQATI